MTYHVWKYLIPYTKQHKHNKHANILDAQFDATNLVEMRQFFNGTQLFTSINYKGGLESN